MSESATDLAADVQLENGHIRIANRLLEALLDSGMSDRQFRICLCLIRLTFGWRQRSARLTYDAFAEACHMNAGGTFRAAVAELVREGVILIVIPGGGTDPNTYALEKDYTKWGRWATATLRLKRRYGERPEAQDEMVRTSAHTQAPSDDTPVHPQAEALPSGGQRDCLPAGRGTGFNPSDDNDLNPRKDRKDRKDITTTATATDGDVENDVKNASDFTLGITKAANDGITRKWGEQIHPIHYGTAHQLASELIAEGISLPLAQRSILDQCDRSKALRPPGSINYFRNGILDANKSDEQRRLDRFTPLLPSDDASARGGKPTSIAYTVAQTQAESRADFDLDQHYYRERDRAARTWADNPANASDYSAILARAKAASVLDITSPIGKRAFDSEVSRLSAEAAGFPSLDVWKTARLSPKPVERP